MGLRLRFTIAHMMCLVAICGVLFFATACYRRHLVYNRLATSHLDEVEQWLRSREWRREALDFSMRLDATVEEGRFVQTEKLKAGLMRCESLIEHHKMLATKYRFLTNHPWCPRTLDPPLPPEP